MKKRILSILVIGLIVANVNAAAPKTSEDKGRKDEKVESAVNKGNEASVKYVGETKDNGIVFDINVQNSAAQRFVLVVSNSQGDILFNQSFKDVNFHKTVMIKKDSDAEGAVNFSVRSNGSELCSKTFQIDTESRIVRKVFVKSVNKFF